tara:strand:+ start:1058 stop:2032 length:975 start_codon:yes stop_codon:yes gene_type:complete
MKLKKKNIAVLAGGDSAEHEISISSANTVLKNINKSLYNPFLIHLKKNSFIALHNNKKIRLDKKDFSFKYENNKYIFDKVFLVIHGPPAENGEIQDYFKDLNIPHSTCSSNISKLTFNKYLCNKKLVELGFKCAISILHKENSKFKQSSKIKLPCFVKPNRSGSSFGVQKVISSTNLNSAIKNALKYDNEVIIEEEIEGKEISCGVFSDINNQTIALPLTEIISYNEFFDYNAKYEGESKEITPAKISQNLSKKIKNISIEIYKKMNLRGICRIDFILKNKIPYVIEINTIPGMSKESIIPQQIKAAGIKMSEVITMSLSNANI